MGVRRLDGAVLQPKDAGLLLLWFRNRPRDAFASIAAGLATVAILINALFLQSGPHPAPIFAHRAAPAVKTASAHHPKPEAAPSRVRAEVISQIQRELAQRGFYDGAFDGVYGAKTDMAIRDFEHAAGLRPSGEPNQILLQVILHSNIKAKPAPVRRDAIADLLAPDRRVTAVQRALADYGYGQIKPSGMFDPQTRAAIERFERERKLPVTGQISERLTRELTAMTGRPLE